MRLQCGGLGLIPGWEDPLEEGVQPTPVFFLENPHGQRSLAGYNPWGPQELAMAERLRSHTLSFSLSHTHSYMSVRIALTTILKFSFGPSYDWFSKLGAVLKQYILVSKSTLINDILFLWSIFPYYLLDSYTAKVVCVHTHFNSSHLSYFSMFFLSWVFDYVLTISLFLPTDVVVSIYFTCTPLVI